MGKSIYTYYKERLIEIGGKNKCLYLKNIAKKNSYDIGRIFEGREDKVAELLKFLWTAGKEPLSLICREDAHQLMGNLGMVEEPEVDESSVNTAEEYEKALADFEKEIIDYYGEEGYIAEMKYVFAVETLLAMANIIY